MLFWAFLLWFRSCLLQSSESIIIKSGYNNKQLQNTVKKLRRAFISYIFLIQELVVPILYIERRNIWILFLYSFFFIYKFINLWQLLRIWLSNILKLKWFRLSYKKNIKYHMLKTVMAFLTTIIMIITLWWFFWDPIWCVYLKRIS